MACLAVGAALACGGARSATSSAPFPHGTMGDDAAIARARADSARYPYTAADIRFMSGMISHHAQAIQMARWAPTHGAGAAVLRLTERIINAQSDEIALMQSWLRDRRQEVPEANPAGMKMTMGGAEHLMLMPGMLTEAQMRELDAARGQEFDRLFLTFMIQHHRGAVVMVKELLDSHGAAQDETVFKFAADVNVDQTTEINRMLQMLLELGLPPRSP
jgi:uncharacterized protein (DUF305 family)